MICRNSDIVKDCVRSYCAMGILCNYSVITSFLYLISSFFNK